MSRRARLTCHWKRQQTLTPQTGWRLTHYIRIIAECRRIRPNVDVHEKLNVFESLWHKRRFSWGLGKALVIEICFPNQQNSVLCFVQNVYVNNHFQQVYPISWIYNLQVTETCLRLKEHMSHFATDAPKVCLSSSPNTRTQTKTRGKKQKPSREVPDCRRKAPNAFTQTVYAIFRDNDFCVVLITITVCSAITQVKKLRRQRWRSGWFVTKLDENEFFAGRHRIIFYI